MITPVESLPTPPFGDRRLVLPEGLPYDRWLAIGGALKHMEENVMWWIGDWWRYGERNYGDMATQAAKDAIKESTGFAYETVRKAGQVSEAFPEFGRRLPNSKHVTFWHFLEVAFLDPEVADAILARAESGGWTQQETRIHAQSARHKARTSIPPPVGRYRCIVLDPPWPMVKIEREERPKQGAVLDYPIMTLEQIEALPVPGLADQDGCHLYLWVTQKFLPDGLRLLESWGFTYQCVMTWVKPTGMTPYSWMYNTEHVLFGTLGGLRLDRLGLKLSFEAPVTVHSEKPDVFYDRAATASPEPRLELFARRPREGFKPWGNEVPTDAA